MLFFNNTYVQPLLNVITINIISAISWLPPLILQLFHQGLILLKAAPFYHSFVGYMPK